MKKAIVAKINGCRTDTRTKKLDMLKLFSENDQPRYKSLRIVRIGGKVWAASDPSRRASKRQKDLADIARLLEGHPELRELVPQAILQRLIE